MRIGIDARFGDARAGLGTYTRELLKELIPMLRSYKVVLFVQSTESSWLKPFKGAAEIVLAPFAPYSLAEQTSFPSAIHRATLDLFYAPHFNVPLSISVPFVCTVHDLILHRFPGAASLPKRFGYRLVLARALKNATKVVTISNATKDDLLHHYGASIASNIEVVYPGVSERFSPQSMLEQDRVREKYGLESPYLLYVGSWKEHKNVPMLIEAFQDAALGDVDLVLVAKGSECESLPKRDRVRHLPNVLTSDLPALYSGALATVTATKDEGFCLPLIEAMACGCPAIGTTIGPIPEVTGGHALLTGPTVPSLADAMKRAIRDPDFHSEKKRAAARAWVMRYSWKNAADRVRKVLTAAL